MVEAPLKHDADQAGGEKEIVYSSDGADSSKISFPPKMGNNRVPADSFGLIGDNEIGSTDELVTENITADQAFEIFSGKLFAINKAKSSSSVNATTEPPLLRLSRLQNELNELQSFVTNSSPGEGNEDNEKMAFESHIQALRTQWSLVSDAYSRRTDVLNSTMKNSVDGLQGKNLGTEKANTVVSAAPVSLLEERLKRIELAVGAGGATYSNVSVLERLAKVENIHSKMDEKQAEQLQKRAKVIRQDLEAAAKARNKLMSVGAGGVGSDDSKTITALYDQLQSLSGMSEHLPILTQRIQSLAQQHSAAATWDSRLRSLEALANTFETQVSAVETCVKNLDVSLQQNTVQMQSNMKTLDQRIQDISKP